VGERGEALCTLHYNSDARLREAWRPAETAYSIAHEPPPPRLLVKRIVEP
jgi:hypothetical protein